MTAIAGVWSQVGRIHAGNACTRVLAAQQMYGPHGSASWNGHDVAMGRSLFRTLPEDAYDRQPQTGGDGRWRLVADVRLDNRAEIAAALGIAADRMHSIADAALLLAAWERWQANSIARLHGDFAFAVWDADEQRLCLVRDALGARPLHYHQGDGFLAFASMPKGLHALSEIPYAPDEQHAADFLGLLPETGPSTFFRNVSRVEPGQLVIASEAGLSTTRHWDPQPRTARRWRREEAEEALRAEVGRAVTARLRVHDGGIGAHLSAGLDSSIIASTAARLLAPIGGEVMAYTAVPGAGAVDGAPSDLIANEGPLAAAVAEVHANMRHALVRTGGPGLLDDFDRDFHLLDRPLFNPLNQRWFDAINAQARRDGVTVMLTGAAGNATISYAGLELLPELLRNGRWLRLLREGGGLVKTGSKSWSGAIAATVGAYVPVALWAALKRRGGRAPMDFNTYTAVHPNHIEALRARARDRGLDSSYRPRSDAFQARLWSLRRFDGGNYQKAALAKSGIDMRDPTADRRLIEFCLSLPTDLFLTNGKTRALARQAFADRLPVAVTQEQRRGYQAADWSDSLNTAKDEIADQVARLRHVPAASHALDLEMMDRLVRDWPKGGWADRATANHYRSALVRGVAVGHFLRKASGSNA